MTGLFERLDTLAIPQTQRISSEDQIVCDQHQAAYEAEVAELNTAISAIEALQPQYPWLKNQLDSLLLDLPRHPYEAHTNMIYRILRHFNNTYSLELNDHEFKSAWGANYRHAGSADMNAAWGPKGVPTSEDIITWVLEQLGGRSFHAVAAEQLASNFLKGVRGAKLSGRNLTLQDHLYLEARWNGGLTLTPGGQVKLMLLADAIAHNDNQSLVTADPDSTLHQVFEAFTENNYRRSDWGETNPVSTPSVASFTVFKNGNVRVQFTSPEAAQAFATRYNLALNS